MCGKSRTPRKRQHGTPARGEMFRNKRTADSGRRIADCPKVSRPMTQKPNAPYPLSLIPYPQPLTTDPPSIPKTHKHIEI